MKQGMHYQVSEKGWGRAYCSLQNVTAAGAGAVAAGVAAAAANGVVARLEIGVASLWFAPR